MQAGYHLLVIVIGIAALWKGWNSGMMNLVPSLLGFSFGAVCAHIFGAPAELYVDIALPWLKTSWAGAFIIQNIARSGIFIIVYLLFRSLTTLFKHAFSLLNSGVLNSIFGAVSNLLIYIMFTSIALNLILCIDQDSALLKFAGDSDANIAGITLLLSPNILGSMDALTLAHLHQMQEAKLIS